MRVTFTTLNSTYVLDHEQGTWERIAHNGEVDPDAPLRTESGRLVAHSAIAVGMNVRLVGPPLGAKDYRAGRLIDTTAVTSVTVQMWTGG